MMYPYTHTSTRKTLGEKSSLGRNPALMVMAPRAGGACRAPPGRQRGTRQFLVAGKRAAPALLSSLCPLKGRVIPSLKGVLVGARTAGPFAIQPSRGVP